MRRREFLYGTAVSGLLYGCGGGGGSSVTGSTSPISTTGVEFHTDSGGILYAIYYQGVDLTQGYGSYEKGGYYIIGGCFKNGVAIDDENNINSQSFRSEGPLGINKARFFKGMLRSKTNFCKGPEYEVWIKRQDEFSVVTEVSIRKLPVDLATLSVPLDLTRDPNNHHFDTYRLSNGRSGRYDSISQNVSTPGGYVGVLEFGPVDWMEACSSSLKVCVRRTSMGGSYRSALIYRHFGTDNLEKRFGTDLPAGSEFFLREEIRIIPQ